MIATKTWVYDVEALVAAIGHRWPQHHHDLDQLTHRTPCPPTCPTCHQRHRAGRCPCPICQAHHPAGPCPQRVTDHDPPRPGCLTCQIVATQHQADELDARGAIDQGDGIRSPSLNGGGRGKGTHSTPTEQAAEQTHHDADALAAAATHRRQTIGNLRRALSTEDDHQRTEWIQAANRSAANVLAALHRLTLPPSGDRPNGGDKGCIGHRKAGAHVPSDPRHRGLCRWCWDFDRAWGQLPPPTLVHHHDAGYRITTTMAEEALKRRKPKKAKPPKRTQPTRRDRMLTRIREAALRLTHP